MSEQHSNYPPKTCDIDRLVTHQRLVDAALAGRKTQQRRNGVYAYPGETFMLGSHKFVVTGLTRQALGDMTDSDARAEGFPDLSTYQQLIISMHAGMDWNDAHEVWVHTFETLEAS